MRLTLTSVAATAALTATALAAPALAHGGDDRAGLRLVGLADSGTRLVAFSSEDPESVKHLGRVRGLRTDTRLVGIDRRVQDGRLYGVGDRGGIYVLSTRGARAERTDNPALPLDGSRAYGVDFNPAANALRVISAQGQNLRVPFAAPGAAAVVDGRLTRPGATPGTTEPATGLTGAAYTNNDTSPTTATTLFDIDTERDQVVIQSPANAGSTAPTGGLGLDLRTNTGFDIHTGSGGALTALAVSAGKLYSVDLLNGDADTVGRIGKRYGSVTDLAVPVQ